MKCPSCQTAFSAAVPQCPKCKLTLVQLDRKFGIVPHFTRYVTDRSAELTSREINKLRALLQLFERKFPQLLFSVLVAKLGSRFSISEYAFWLINRARFSSLDAIGPKNFDLLLVVDPAAETSALIVGYALEEYLSERDLESALVAASNTFRTGDFAGGIRECVEFMIRRLREIALSLEEKKAPVPGADSDTQ